MVQAFSVPSCTSYMNMYSNLVSDSKVLMVASCISQCTGCKCSCNKVIQDFDFEW